jgi:hypothetical protein
MPADTECRVLAEPRHAPSIGQRCATSGWATERQRAGTAGPRRARFTGPMHRVVIRTPSISAAVRVLATASLVQSGADSVSSRRAVALRSGDAAVAGAAPARSMLGFDPMPCHADLDHQRADSHRHDARQNEMKFIHAKPPPWPASPKSSPRRVRQFDHRGLQGNPARPAVASARASGPRSGGMNEHDPEERDPAGALAEGEVIDSRQLARAWTLRGTRFRIASGGGVESVPLLSICAACRLIRRSGVRNAGTPSAAERSRAASCNAGTSSST